jgi:hypothetical protein
MEQDNKAVRVGSGKEHPRLVYRVRVANSPEPLSEEDARLLLDCAFGKHPWPTDVPCVRG